MKRNPSLIAVLLATFTVSASFGLILPLAPQLVRAAGPDAADVALHSGGLTAIYMLAIAVFAPFWGRLSDRRGRRPVLVVGLIGFALSMAGFALVRSLPQLYLERLLSGLFAAAISPVAAAFVADRAPSDQWRASRMAWLNMASIAGFVLGPALSVWSVPLETPPGGRAVLFGALPFAGAAGLALLAAAGVGLAMRRPTSTLAMAARPAPATRFAGSLLGLTFVTAVIVGIFEVAVSLRSGRLAGASRSEIGAMFAVCSLVMFITQAVLFSPWVRAHRTWRVLAPAFLLLAGGLFLASTVGGFGGEMAVVALVAASAGAVSPTLAYWLSLGADKRQGAQLGRQTAAASLGQALGSAGGGWLLSRLVVGDPFLWAAALALTGALVSLRVAPRLGRFVAAAGPRREASQAEPLT